MKKRGIIVASFLLIAALVMGIGFATLSDNLFIKGDATLATTSAQTNFDEDVYFDAAVVAETTGSNTATADSVVKGSSDPDSATFYVKSLGNMGEYVVFKFTIKNDSTEFDAEITLDAGHPECNNDKFKVFYCVDEDFDGSADHQPNVGPVTCAKNGGTVDVYVAVLLLSSPTENTSATFNVNLTATAKQ